MSNNRPYRATYVSATRTVHYDYATKEARGLLEGDEELYAGAHRGRDGEKRFSTVTSRKPLKPGTPVCWVNVYAEGHPASHRTKAFADSAASTATLPRLHCIPVYLPGEGAPHGPDAYYKQWRDMKAERDAAQAEVEQKHDTITAVVAQRDQAYAEVERLTKELAAAQAQAMPAELASLTAELASLRLTCEEFKRQRDEARNGPTAQALAQAFANGQREALADVRVALGIKEPAK